MKLGEGDDGHGGGSGKSTLGGGLFLGITLCSVLYVIVIGVLNIVHPGWAGES